MSRSTLVRHKKISFKQKATQTDIYDDLFMSDESFTSNEDTQKCSLEGGGAASDVDDQAPIISYEHMSTNTSSNYSVEQSVLRSQRAARRHFIKKSPKRRKSLPPQQHRYNNEAAHAVTQCVLIPRGPLICSNNESIENWLPRSVFYLNKNKPALPVVKSKILASPELLDYDLHSLTKESGNAMVVGFEAAVKVGNSVPIAAKSPLNSDYEMNEYNEDFKDNDALIEDTFSSNDEDNDVFVKFKEDEVCHFIFT